MNNTVIIAFFSALVLILEVSIVWAAVVAWGVKERFCAIMFAALAVVSTFAFVYLIIGGFAK